MVKINIAAFAALASFVAALPSVAVERRQDGPYVPFGPQYYLRTKVIAGDHSKNGLYAHYYHTYAGGADIVLLPDRSTALQGFLNGTNQQFNLSNPVAPWSLVLEDVYYDGWSPVHIQPGEGTGGFFFNSSGLQIDHTTGLGAEFGGWLACDWSHGLPQLFWKFYYIPNSELPSTCALVNLRKVPV